MEIDKKIKELEGQFIMFNVMEKHIISIQLKMMNYNPYTYWAG